MTEATEHIFRYVPHHELERCMALGWIPTEALLGCSHGDYSILCELDPELAVLLRAVHDLDDEM